ncbi:type II toxin-antitoxin system RelE/ParE family toxin [Burkholderiaceae bacterium DAT-1]|nr:type II toxin-antitoxin system RelE/ParE family toxin [Burkholderiaceae bacterium DAT-1]
MTYSIAYYSESVQRAILKYPPDILAHYLRLTDMLEAFGPLLRMPHSRAMGDGLFELRPKGRSGIGRVFYCFQLDQQIVILHSFFKKTEETPGHELRMARQRMKEMKDAHTRRT